MNIYPSPAILRPCERTTPTGINWLARHLVQPLFGLLCLLAWQPSIVLAQKDDLNVNKAPTPPANLTFTQCSDRIMQLLDMSEAETGILCDRMFAWEVFPVCYGECPGGNLNGFAQALEQLYGSAFTNEARATMMNPDRLTGRVMRNSTPSVVPVGILHFDYNMLNPDALDLGILTLRNDGLLVRNPAVPGPVFERTTVVYPAILATKIKKGPLALKFTRDLFFHNNPTNPLVSIRVTYEDQPGYWNEVTVPVSAFTSGALEHFVMINASYSWSLGFNFANGDSHWYYGFSGLSFVD